MTGLKMHDVVDTLRSVKGLCFNSRGYIEVKGGNSNEDTSEEEEECCDKGSGGKTVFIYGGPRSA